MVGIAKSERQKRQIGRKEVSSKRTAAVKAYRERLATPSSTKVTVRAIAKEFGVDHVTLGRDLNSTHRNIDDFNASKTKLSAVQEAELVRWAISLADRNLSLTPSLIHEHASLLYESTNPGATLGTSWTNRFLDRHQDELSRHWSRPLDKVRAMSATPTSMKRYFDTYKSIVGENGEKIPPHRQFAYDESGVQRGHSQPTCVVSSRHNKAVKVNKGGSRELITFIPIIAASGELVNSIVVFPGKLLRENWVKDNPGNYAATCSARGFMTDALGLEFIKHFHNLTAHLEAEGPRLLHVDCHSSHINLPLIQFARAHNVIIFGYPPHTTHLLQGLDVVIFSPFKNAYAKHAAEHLKVTGEDVEKPAFLSVLHKAVQDSFTEKNILMAWKKTGLRPIDPGVISDTDLAPSREFSIAFTLPLPPPTPIQAVVDAIHRQNTLRDPHHLAAATATLNLRSSSLPPSEPAPPLEASTPAINPINTTEGLPHSTTILAPHACPPSQFPPILQPNFADPLALLTAGIHSISLDKPLSAQTHDNRPILTLPAPGPETGVVTAATEDTDAVYLAGEILRSLSSTRLAPILELDTVTSACELPPVERGPLPTDIVKAIDESGDLPSPELWSAIKIVFPQLVARADRLLAQAILQETYCQQLQRKLKLKENPRKQTTLKKIMGLGEGLIFTGDCIVEALEEAAAVKEQEKLEAQSKQDAKALKKDAKAWMDAAVARQKEAHASLIEAWKGMPTNARSRRQPAKPALDTVPEQYVEALKPKKRKPRKQAGTSSPPESETEHDSYHSE